MENVMVGPVIDIPVRSMDDAKRQYAEQYGDALVLNTYLKISVVGLTLVILGLVGLNFYTQSLYSHVKPLVVRIDDMGRPSASSYEDASTYTPKVKEIRYFLKEFVRKHYGRSKLTFQQDFADSLFFMNQVLAGSTMQQVTQTQMVENFLRDATADEIQIEPKNIVLVEPMKALVDYDVVHIQVGNRQEVSRKTNTAVIAFQINNALPSNFDMVNPLGFQITSLESNPAIQ